MSALAWFWLGYTDEDQPKGQRAMGCVVVKANDDMHALYLASGLVKAGWVCNVGEIAKEWGDPPPAYADRLLDRAEAEALAKAWDPGHGGLANPDDIAEAFGDDGAQQGQPLFRGRR